MKEPRFEDELMEALLLVKFTKDTKSYIFEGVTKAALKIQKHHQATRDAWILEKFKKKIERLCNDYDIGTTVNMADELIDDVIEELKKLLGGKE